MQNPENAAQLARVTEAAQRVAELQAESERLAAEMAAAAADQAASAEAAERRGAEAAAKLMAEAEVAAKAKLLQAAQLQAESADAARQKWASDIDEVRGGGGPREGCAAAQEGCAAQECLEKRCFHREECRLHLVTGRTWPASMHAPARQ